MHASSSLGLPFDYEHMSTLLVKRDDSSDGDGISPVWLAFAIIIPILFTVVAFVCFCDSRRPNRREKEGRVGLSLASIIPSPRTLLMS